MNGFGMPLQKARNSEVSSRLDPRKSFGSPLSTTRYMGSSRHCDTRNGEPVKPLLLHWKAEYWGISVRSRRAWAMVLIISFFIFFKTQGPFSFYHGWWKKTVVRTPYCCFFCFLNGQEKELEGQPRFDDGGGEDGISRDLWHKKVCSGLSDNLQAQKLSLFPSTVFKLL